VCVMRTLNIVEYPDVDVERERESLAVELLLMEKFCLLIDNTLE